MSICLILALTALAGCTNRPIPGAKTPVIESLETPDAIEFGTPFTVRWTGRDLPDRMWLEYSTSHGQMWLNCGEVPSLPDHGETTLVIDERQHFHRVLSIQRAAWLRSPPGEVVGKPERYVTNVIVLLSDPQTWVWKQSGVIPVRSVPWLWRWWFVPTIPIWIAAVALMIVDRNIFKATSFAAVFWWFVLDWYLPSVALVTAGVIGTAAVFAFGWSVLAIERLLGVRWSYPLELLLWGGAVVGVVLVPVAGLLSWLRYVIPGYGLLVCALPIVLAVATRRTIQMERDELLARYSQPNANPMKIELEFVVRIMGFAFLPALAVAAINWFILGKWGALNSFALIQFGAALPAFYWNGRASQDWQEQLKTVAIECMAQGNLAGCLRALEARRDAGQLTEVEDLRFYAEVLSLVGRDAEAAAVMAQQEAEQQRIAKNVMGVMAAAGASEAADSVRVQMARGLVNLGQYAKALERLPAQPAEERLLPEYLEVRCLALARLGQPAQALEALKPLDRLPAFMRRAHADVIENLDLLRMECLTDLNRVEEASRVLEELGPRLATRYAPGHPRRVRAEFIQATLLRSRRLDEPAIDRLEKVMMEQRTFLVQSAVDLPEESLLAVSRHMERDLARYLGDVLGFHRDAPNRVATAFEITVNRKGLGLDAAAEWHRARRGHLPTANRPALLDPEPVRLSELQAALSNDVTMIEYARAAVGDREPSSARVDHYIAFVLPRGSDRVSLIDLGEAALIDAKVQEYRRRIDPQGTRGLGAAPPSSPGKPERAANWQPIYCDLYVSCFEPIANTVSLPCGEPLLISPAGALSWISFSSLLQPSGRFLIEDHSIRLATSAARAVGSPSNGTTVGPPAFFGAPDFGAAPVISGTPRSRRLPHGLRDRIGPFAPLPGTLQEIEGIRALYTARSLPADVLTGPAASARNVLDLNPARRLLHIATHGFFVPPAYLPTELAALTLLPDRSANAGKDDASSAGLSPYLRCGLALAGANANGDQEEGLLTAEDLLTCSLEGTQLVVLSACETARGDVSGLCDVQSLVRAFLIAGAETVVASLWQVPDDETAQLMTAFHGNWLTQSVAAEALQSAVRPYLANVRAKRLDPDPLIWAAFQVFVG